MKICCLCKQEKSLDKFYKFRYSKDGHSYRCKECNYKVCRDSHLKCKFGITQEEYDLMFKEQGGVCKLCEDGEDEFVDSTVIKGPKQFAIDHDHYTGEVRGLLCSKCNKGLGQFRDNAALLHKAAFYVENKGNLHGYF